MHLCIPVMQELLLAVSSSSFSIPTLHCSLIDVLEVWFVSFSIAKSFCSNMSEFKAQDFEASSLHFQGVRE